MDDVITERSRVLKDLENPYLIRIANGEPISDVLAEAIAALKQEARANGLTNEILDAEIAAWYAERED